MSLPNELMPAPSCGMCEKPTVWSTSTQRWLCADIGCRGAFPSIQAPRIDREDPATDGRKIHEQAPRHDRWQGSVDCGVVIEALTQQINAVKDAQREQAAASSLHNKRITELLRENGELRGAAPAQTSALDALIAENARLKAQIATLSARSSLESDRREIQELSRQVTAYSLHAQVIYELCRLFAQSSFSNYQERISEIIGKLTLPYAYNKPEQMQRCPHGHEGCDGRHDLEDMPVATMSACHRCAQLECVCEDTPEERRRVSR